MTPSLFPRSEVSTKLRALHFRPWRTVEQVELATSDWVKRWNNAHLHGELNYHTPIEIDHA